jgi:metallo-beta-lactamase class B
MLARIALLLFLLVSPLTAQTDPTWTTNHVPFRIAGNLYYVGSEDLAAYLVVTPQGNILINANLTSSPPQIRASIERLGFKFSDTKVLLNSQAHYDHSAGTAAIKRLTHARLEVMDADVPAMESGGRDDFLYANRAEFHFPPVKVDRILHDGDQVKLGATVLTAHKTAGHTPGCTTWTMQVTEAGHTYNVVIVGGVSANPGSNFIHQPRYPTQAADFAQTFRTLHDLPCDIFLGGHGLYFDLNEKYPRLGPGKPNPFIDPAGYRAFVSQSEQSFKTELAQQTKHPPQ